MAGPDGAGSQPEDREAAGENHRRAQDALGRQAPGRQLRDVPSLRQTNPPPPPPPQRQPSPPGPRRPPLRPRSRPGSAPRPPP